MITGEGPLLAMSKGALDFDQALERGLLRVEGDEQDRARVIQGLRAAAALMANPEKSDSVALR